MSTDKTIVTEEQLISKMLCVMDRVVFGWHLNFHPESKVPAHQCDFVSCERINQLIKRAQEMGFNNRQIERR